jgi:large subunit ribosomal protein L7/L12
MATKSKLLEIADALSKLTALEAKELSLILENDYNIKAKSISVPVQTPTIEFLEKEQIEFDIYLNEIGGQKLQVIKKVNELLGLGLKESKELVDSVPCLLRKKVLTAEAQTIKKDFESINAIIEIK